MLVLHNSLNYICKIFICVCHDTNLFSQRNKLKKNHHLHDIKFLIFNLLLSRSRSFHFLYLIQIECQLQSITEDYEKSPQIYQINYKNNSLNSCHLNCMTIRWREFWVSVCNKAGNELELLKTAVVCKQALVGLGAWRTLTLCLCAQSSLEGVSLGNHLVTTQPVNLHPRHHANPTHNLTNL